MFTIKEIQSILLSSGNLFAENDVITDLLTDSRKLSNPKQTLFFAKGGSRLDGHHYIDELYQKGVRNFIVERPLEVAYKNCNIIVVKNAILAMQSIVKAHRDSFSYPVIGITGSNGKTIVKEWLNQLLEEDFTIVRSPKSYNSQIGVPLSVWKMDQKHRLGIFEAGISEPDEMQNLQKVIQPTIGIFTNIGSAHGQNFINEIHKAKEKLKLFLRSKVLIYCKDHTTVNQAITSFWQHTINDIIEKPRFFSWSEKVAADIKITYKKVGKKSIKLKCFYQENEIGFKIPFTDTSSFENVMHCIALMLYLEYTPDRINAKLQKLKRVEMRLEQKTGLNQCVIINDSYNSDIESLRIALDFLGQQRLNDKRTVILSDILQSGISGVDLYATVAQMLERAKVTKFIGIGKELFHHKFLIEKINGLKRAFFYASTDEFLEKELESHFQQETILLKGARSFQFERINAFLEEKAHATVFEVNLNDIVHNLNFFTSKLKPNTKVMVMVKAFAYGAGLYEIAKLLEFHQIDYLGVAYADEGVTLRKAGITLPIMVLNPEKRSFDAIIKYHLEPEMYSFELLKDFSEQLSIAGHKAVFPVHINIDTGMKRLGFEPIEIDELGLMLSSNKQLKVASIYSHLAASDETHLDTFTHTQIQLFEQSSQKLMKWLSYKPLRHIVNSFGILRFADAHYDMVRLGLGLYGINPSYQDQLEPIGTLKSKISQIRTIKKGETVGYSRMGKMEKDGRIGIIAIGYADGLKRALSNGVGSVYLHNKKAPIIGNVCMDMTMIDLSNIPEAQVGEDVELFGKNISVEEVAHQAGTISYEILTSISERVKRVFFME